MSASSSQDLGGAAYPYADKAEKSEKAGACDGSESEEELSADAVLALKQLDGALTLPANLLQQSVYSSLAAVSDVSAPSNPPQLLHKRKQPHQGNARCKKAEKSGKRGVPVSAAMSEASCDYNRCLDVGGVVTTMHANAYKPNVDGTNVDGTLLASRQALAIFAVRERRKLKALKH